MNIIILVSRLLLSAVFSTAGLTKLTDQAGFQQALIDFGLPNPLVSPLGILLPLSEFVIAIALISVSGAWWGALGALSLLLLFIIGIVVNLARGRTPDCHCFGRLHSEPIGWSILIRNGLLAAIAGFVVWQGPNQVSLSMVGGLASMATSPLISLLFSFVGLGLLAIEGWFILHLLRQQGRLLIRIETLETHLNAVGPAQSPFPTPPAAKGLPVGIEAPAFRLLATNGEMVTLDMLLSAGKPVLLIFVDPNCGPCSSLLPDIARWQREYAVQWTIVLISRGSVAINRAKSVEHGLMYFLLQQDYEVAKAYQVQYTPSAVVVLPDGVIGSSLVSGGAEAIQPLLKDTIKPSVGIPMPIEASNTIESSSVWRLVVGTKQDETQLTRS